MADEAFKQFVMDIIRDMARKTFRDQDYDDLLAFIGQHEEVVAPNIRANAKVLEAFTILDSYWSQSDMDLMDYGDEQSDAIYVLMESILGKAEVSQLLQET